MFEDDWYDAAGSLTAEERGVYERVREWAQERVAPRAAALWEDARFDRDLFDEMADLGVIGGTIADHGGPGLSAVGAHLVGVALATVDGSMSTSYGVHSSLAMRSIDRLGSEDQRARWLPRMARMELLGAFALTEPDHGSDVVRLETRAERDGDDWVLTGEKHWIGHGDVADVVVVWARDDDDRVGGFVVDHTEADGDRVDGFTTDRMLGKAALRSIWQAEIHLDAVRVPATDRLANADSFADTGIVLMESRAGVAWECLGYAEAAYRLAKAHTVDREQFGRSLASFQLVQERLASMLAQLTALRTMLLHLGRVEEDGGLTMEKAALAKLHAARTARAMLADARDLHGGVGILLDREVARFHADIEAPFTYEGADNVQALLVGRGITGESAFA